MSEETKTMNDAACLEMCTECCELIDKAIARCEAMMGGDSDAQHQVLMHDLQLARTCCKCCCRMMEHG